MENNDNQLLSSIFDRKEGPMKFLFGSIFFLTGILVTAFSYLYGLKVEAIIRNGITGFLCGGIIVYMLVDASSRKLFSYDNGIKRDRFVIVYYLGLIISLCLPKIATESWPYLFIFLLHSFRVLNLLQGINSTILGSLSIL